MATGPPKRRRDYKDESNSAGRRFRARLSAVEADSEDDVAEIMERIRSPLSIPLGAGGVVAALQPEVVDLQNEDEDEDGEPEVLEIPQQKQPEVYPDPLSVRLGAAAPALAMAHVPAPAPAKEPEISPVSMAVEKGAIDFKSVYGMDVDEGESFYQGVYHAYLSVTNTANGLMLIRETSKHYLKSNACGQAFATGAGEFETLFQRSGLDVARAYHSGMELARSLVA